MAACRYSASLANEGIEIFGMAGVSSKSLADVAPFVDDGIFDEVLGGLFHSLAQVFDAVVHYFLEKGQRQLDIVTSVLLAASACRRRGSFADFQQYLVVGW